MKKLILGILFIGAFAVNSFAALATLPYKFKITSVTNLGGVGDVMINFSILDGSNVVIVSGVQIDAAQPPTNLDDLASWWDSSVEGPIRILVFKQMGSDAGSGGNLLNGVINKNIPVN